jgi:hypothetical protein
VALRPGANRQIKINAQFSSKIKIVGSILTVILNCIRTSCCLVKVELSKRLKTLNRYAIHATAYSADVITDTPRKATFDATEETQGSRTLCDLGDSVKPP